MLRHSKMSDNKTPRPNVVCTQMMRMQHRVWIFKIHKINQT